MPTGFIRQAMMLLGPVLGMLSLMLAIPASVQAADPTIQNISTNATAYPNGEIPLYEKFEITFQVDTVAQNLQLPYDATPPPGVDPGLGISVDALFTPDNWQTIYSQPAFYYQEFQDEVKSGNEWFYPTGNFSWKVRFAPDQAGSWQFKLTAQDADGTYETQPFAFTVVSGANKGFIKVSQADSRYFEHDDGTYFPGLGYNLNYRRVDWVNPVLANQDNFQVMAENKIQLIRIWLSQWSIFGSAWNPWRSHNPAHQGQIPDTRLRHDAAPPFNLIPGVDPPIARAASETFLWLSHDETVFGDGNQWNFAPCMLLGWEAPQLPVKRNTNYRVRVRYREQDLTGPKIGGQPYGFAVKLGGWLWHNNDETQRCYYPNQGTPIAATYSTTNNWSHYPDPQNQGWQILAGTFNSGNTDFINNFYLVIENATSGQVFVDYVWLEEDFGNNQYGTNIIYKPWMAHHQYFDQRNSYALDKTLDQAKLYNIYVKPVILEKQDYSLNIFEFDGSLSIYLPHQNPQELFFGNGRESGGKTKIRWLEEAWWRYLQARWGYSPNIHSWELLNEGNPNSTSHHILADELGKYFQQTFIPQGQQTKHPNMHLVTTSFWHSFPNSFWSSSNYPFVDYADIHHYAQESSTFPLGYIYNLNDFYDAAAVSQKLSLYHGAKQANGPNKPVMRGETGFLFDNTDLFTQNATNGIWLHNFIWAGINAGGLIESFWVGAPTQSQIYKSGSHDHRPMFKTFANFISDIPLSNGQYQDAGASTSHPSLRVWGQKDLVNGHAHLWIQNKDHTWKNVADGTPIPAVSGTITVSGFQPDESYILQWWDPYQPDLAQQITETEAVIAQSNGAIEIAVDNLNTDVAAKIFPSQQPLSISLPAYWKLDETSGSTYADFYNSGHNATCVGNCPTPTQGQVNGGQQFNGSNTGLDIPANPAFDWSAADNFSVEFWMKGISGQSCASSNEIIIGRIDNSANPLWSLGCTDTTGYAYFQLSDLNGANTTLESTSPITDGIWHHIVGVRNNSANYLYIDGQEVASTTIAYSGGFTSPAPLNIGWLNSGTGFHFNGTIDEVALYDEALFETEIRTHYYLARGFAEACSTPVRIMPLGDSITRGVSSGVSDPTKQISYRKDLWDSLIAAGYSIDFVGSLVHGQFYTGFDPDHEGRSGWRDDQLVAEIYDNGGANWLDTHRLNGTPVDVVLLHIGTNDINWHDPNNVDELLDEINQYEAANNTSVTVIVARMIHRLNYSSGTATHNFNDTTEAVALERLANGDKIIMVDMENGASIDYAQYPPGDMWDWGHPYATGYTKMAAVWYDALDDFLPLCVEEPPNITSTPVITATVGELYSYDVEATGSPAPTYTSTISPTGMTINTISGMISWIPSSTGNFDVTVEANNSTGTDTQSFTINVSEAPVVLPTIAVTKTANPTAVPEPRGTVTFSVQVDNTGVEAVTLTGLVDDIHGNLDGQGDCALTQTIVISGLYECSFTAAVSGNAGMQETDTITATVEDDDSNQASDNDSATVTVTDVLPTIAIIKTANPTSVPEPGGTVTFTVQVENTSVEAVTLIGLVDDVHGDLDGQGDCALTQAIALNGTYECSFTVTISGNAGLQETDTITATVEDDEGNQADDSDSATVTVGDTPSSILVSKMVTPTTLTEPGGMVTFTVRVDNTSPADSVTLNSLVDSIYGLVTSTVALSSTTCLLPQAIAVGGDYTCNFTAFVSGAAGESKISEITASGLDNDNEPVTGSDTATVTLEPVASPQEQKTYLPVITKSN